jgi:hypothetical protein
VISISKYLSYTIERFAKENQNSVRDFAKGIIKKYMYKEYFFIKNKKEAENILSNLNGKCDVLIPFFPYRSDYELFIFPVIEEMLNNGLNITLIIPKKALSSTRIHSLKKKDLQILIYEELITQLVEYSKLNKYCRDNIKVLRKNYSSEIYNFSKIYSMFYTFSFEYIMANKLLEILKPRVVYGIHFVLNPGFLEAIKEKGLNVHLIQHGFFNSNLHDFIGSNLVYLWGTYHQERLKKIDSSIESIVIGNPKLTNLRIADKYTLNEKMSILLISSGNTFSNKVLYRMTLNAIKAIKAYKDSNVVLKYRLHPSEDIDDYREWIERGILRENEIIHSSNDVYNDIYQSEVVIGALSTVINEAAYLNRLAIRLFDPSLMEEIGDGIIKVGTKEDLDTLLFQLLNDDYYKQLLTIQKQSMNNIFLPNSNAGKSIADIIKEYIKKLDVLNID